MNQSIDKHHNPDQPRDPSVTEELSELFFSAHTRVAQIEAKESSPCDLPKVLLTGTEERAIDEKGRLVIPPSMRHAFINNCAWLMENPDGPGFWIVPPDVMKEVVLGVMDLPKGHSALKRALLNGIGVLELDDQYRVRFIAPLLAKLGISGPAKVELRGSGNFIELLVTERETVH